MSCGYYNDHTHECHCTQSAIERYLQKISGPIIDRIDIVTQVNVENYDKLNDSSDNTETSAQIKKRIDRARKFQAQRFNNNTLYFNAQLSPKQLETYCKLGENEKALMKSAFNRYKMSARGYHRILKLARTIADLSQEETIQIGHLTEALQYRGLDTKYFG